MGERKYRRPTVAQVRELESKLSELMDITVPVTKYNDLKTECDTLQKSNEHMENELERMRAKVSALRNTINELQTDIYCLRHRSFWERVFNT